MTLESVNITPALINTVKRIGQETDLIPSAQSANSLQSQKLVNLSSLEYILEETIQYLLQTQHPDSVDDSLILTRLDDMGFRIGYKLVERYTKDKPRFLDSLEIIKFICKEFWFLVFKKQVDHLKTNHRGVYVLYDNQFNLIYKLSGFNSQESISLASKYAWFTCGIIRGALNNLGLFASVTPELVNLPQCTFQIKLTKL